MNDTNWSMFKNDCMWSVFCASEESEKFQGKILVDHQIHKTHTIIETVQARLQDLTNVATEIDGISSWQHWQTESWKPLSLSEPPKGSLLRSVVHEISDSALCVGSHTATEKEASATKISELWDPMTYIDKFESTSALSRASLVFLWTRTRKSAISLVHEQTERSMISHCQKKKDAEIRNSFTSNILWCWTLLGSMPGILLSTLLHQISMELCDALG